MSTQEAKSRATNETIDSLYAISQLLNTGLDRTALMSCVSMIEGGANPEALAAVVRELKTEAAASAPPQPPTTTSSKRN